MNYRVQWFDRDEWKFILDTSNYSIARGMAYRKARKEFTETLVTDENGSHIAHYLPGDYHAVDFLNDDPLEFFNELKGCYEGLPDDFWRRACIAWLEQ